jgi:hypothetical protein
VPGDAAACDDDVAAAGADAEAWPGPAVPAEPLDGAARGEPKPSLGAPESSGVGPADAAAAAVEDGDEAPGPEESPTYVALMAMRPATARTATIAKPVGRTRRGGIPPLAAILTSGCCRARPSAGLARHYDAGLAPM